MGVTGGMAREIERRELPCKRRKAIHGIFLGTRFSAVETETFFRLGKLREFGPITPVLRRATVLLADQSPGLLRQRNSFGATSCR